MFMGLGLGAIFGSFIVFPILAIWALYKFLDAISYRIEKHYGICRWASASKYNEPDDYDYLTNAIAYWKSSTQNMSLTDNFSIN